MHIMQVHVKTPRTKVLIEGVVSSRLLSALKEDFGDKLIIEDDEYELVKNMHWYKDTKDRMKANDYMHVYREIRCLTQDQLGKKLGGLSRQWISDIENGRRPIGKEVAKKLAEIFNTSVDKFL
jgi:DNA-binding XRE family transcriptional regulator